MPSPQSKGFGKSEFQCAVHKSDTIASFHFTLLRAVGKSQDQSWSEFATVGSIWLWGGRKAGTRAALWAAGKERSVTVRVWEAQHPPQWTARVREDTACFTNCLPSEQNSKGLRMKTISTDRAAFHEAFCKSLLFRRVGKGNSHFPFLLTPSSAIGVSV